MTQDVNDDDIDYDDLPEFDATLSDERRECELALFFDTRWMHGIEPSTYIAKALTNSGMILEAHWVRDGFYRSSTFAIERLWLLFVEHVDVARPFDFPADTDALFVAQLEHLQATLVGKLKQLLIRDAAFVGTADVSHPSELRAVLADTLEWR